MARGAHGQHLGDAPALPAPRARRRPRHRGRNQIPERRLGSAARLVSANERCFKSLRETYRAFAMCPGPEDVFLGSAGPADHGAAPARAREAGARHGAMARGAAGGRAGSPPCARERSRPRDLEARFQRLVGAVLGRAEACSDKALAAMLDGLALFGWAIPGAVSRASSMPFDCADIPDRDAMGARRARPAFPYRARRSRRSQARSRCRASSACGKPIAIAA